MTTTAEPSAFAQEPAQSAVAVVPVAPAARGRSKRPFVLGALAAVAAMAGGGYWFSTRGHETTDDAQIDAEIVAIPARVSGIVQKVDFVENQTVNAGTLLAELDDAAAKAKLAQAQASLESAEANADAADADAQVAAANAVGNKAAADATVTTASTGAMSANDQIREAEASARAAEATRAQAQIDRDRSAALAKDGAVSKAALDQAETMLSTASSNAEAARARLTTLSTASKQATSRVVEAQARAKQSNNVDAVVAQANARAKGAHAQVDTAKAARDLASLDLSYTKIYAPHDGVVSKKTIAEGQNVGAGQTIVQLVTPGVWITANFKETQVAHMKVGQPVTLEVDAFPSDVVKGEVESLSGGTGSKFTLLPPDNASGNFTKIVQRLPVRIKVTGVPANVVLRPGMSVDVRVQTGT